MGKPKTNSHEGGNKDLFIYKKKQKTKHPSNQIQMCPYTLKLLILGEAVI